MFTNELKVLLDEVLKSWNELIEAFWSDFYNYFINLDGKENDNVRD